MGDIIIGDKNEFRDHSRKVDYNFFFEPKKDSQSGYKSEDNEFDYAEFEEVSEDEPTFVQREVMEESTEKTKPEMNPDLPPEDIFVNIVKKIVTKAAEKNNQTIEAKPNGRLTPYIYYIDADVICMVLDDLRDNYPHYILNLLNEYRYNDGVSVVAPFISRILKIEGLTCKDFQNSDMQFAFEPYYQSSESAVKRMSDKLKSKDNADLLINTFEALVKKHKKS